jgi:hypothetical protein
VLATLLLGVQSLAPPATALGSVDVSTDRTALNDGLLACYHSSYVGERTAEIVQPWLLLAVMRTPADEVEEHTHHSRAEGPVPPPP